VKGFPVAAGILAVALLAGCSERGVSLGSENLCVLDPRFTALTDGPQGENVSNCARIGENVLVNASFEQPKIGTCNNGAFCQFPATDVTGWSTTSAVQVIEIWNDGNGGVPADDGSQFCELDATSPDTVSQDVALPPGQLMYWSLSHRGRLGTDTMEVLIGPPDAPVSQGIFMSPNDAWYSYSGLYRTGPGEATTRFSMASHTAGSEGNFVDAVVFALVAD
jgi:hypothetical protein